MAVFGANASGKTKLLQSLGFLQLLVLDTSSRLKPDDKLSDIFGEQFFCFRPNPDRVTQLFIEFELDHIEYHYSISFDTERIVSESLFQKRTRFSYIFEREWTGNSYKFRAQNFGSDPKKIPQRQNTSVIATATLLDNPIAKTFDRFFSSLYGNLDIYGRSEIQDPTARSLLDTAEFYNENPEHFEWVNHRIENFDLGLSGIQLTKGELPQADGKAATHYFPYGVHKHNDTEFPLPLFSESRGTQALFVMLRYILPVLGKGGLAFIDEFELGLHSHMIPCLVDLFLSKKHNPLGAQLIFSCHSDFILNQLEKYQIQLVEKDTDGVSQTYRLDSIRGVRNIDNHYAKYHTGAYGGVPSF